MKPFPCGWLCLFSVCTTVYQTLLFISVVAQIVIIIVIIIIIIIIIIVLCGDGPLSCEISCRKM